MNGSPRPVQPLGKPVTVGGFEVFIRRIPSRGLDLFRVTMLLNNEENAEAEFVVVGGRVYLQYAAPALLMPYGGAHQGRARLQAALQEALKLPAPVSPERAEWRAARTAWLERRCLENARRLNRATAALRTR